MQDIEKITESIIGSAFTVHNTLGCGFLEKVYENSLCVELRHNGHFVEQQKEITVEYRGQKVGGYIADIVVDHRVIVELKAVEQITNIHKAQLINYLKATNVKAGLLLNFANPKLEIKRVSN